MDNAGLAAVTRNPVVLGAIGLGGSALMALSSYWVGAIPVWYRTHDVAVVSLLSIGSPGPRVAFYVGLAALALAWLQLGRMILDGYDNWRQVRSIGIRWMLPFVLAAPLSSRDLWAYAAQNHLVAHGIDPYTSGPAVLPDAFQVEVSHRWLSATTPYGPLWLGVGRVIAEVFGNHVTPTVYALRLFAVLGFALLAWQIPTISRRGGGRAEIGLWLTIANPLFLIHGVGGGHNDIVMAGLMAWGLALATNAGPMWRTLGLGLLVLTAGAAVKSPAIITAAFAIPLWYTASIRDARWQTGRGRVAVCGVAIVLVIGVFAVITAVSGVGTGWISQVNNSAPIVTWMSLPSAAAMLWKLAHGTVRGSTHLDSTMRGFRTAGAVLSLILMAWLWLRAFRRAPWPELAIALLAVVVLGPTVQPWYFCWALVAAAAFLLNAELITLIGGLSVALVLMVRPNGTGFQMKPVVLVFLALGVGAAWMIMRSRDRAKVAV